MRYECGEEIVLQDLRLFLRNGEMLSGSHMQIWIMPGREPEGCLGSMKQRVRDLPNG
jgi:hypothetical protein